MNIRFTLLFILCTIVFLSGCQRNAPIIDTQEVARKGLHSATFSQNGTVAVIGSIYHGGSYWRVTDHERIFNWNHQQGEMTTLVASDMSPDSQWSLTASANTLVLWNNNTGAGERFWSTPGEILDVALAKNAAFAILAMDNNTAVIFDVRNGGIKRTFNHGNRVRSVDLSEDNRIALTGSEDNSAIAWDVKSGQKLSWVTHQEPVQLVRLSNDGELALSVSKYDKALLWHTHNGETVAELPIHSEFLRRGLHYTSARFNADTTQLLTGRPDQIVELWDLQKLKIIARWKLPKRKQWKPTSAAVLDVSFSATENEYLAAASNGLISRLTRQQP